LLETKVFQRHLVAVCHFQTWAISKPEARHH
jgi:hypothetical protein